MKPIPAALVAGTLIVGSQWAQDKAPSIDNAIGVGGVAVGLALLDQVNEKLASAFGLLIVVAIAFSNVKYKDDKGNTKTDARAVLIFRKLGIV